MCLRIDSVFTEMVHLFHKDGEAPRKEGKKMTTATMTKIDQAVMLVIADGECAVPQYNEFGGVDVWTEGQAGYITTSRQTYFAEGVRVSLDDETINVIKFVGKAFVAAKVTLSGDVSVELLRKVIKGLL
jgi:hypothetical protein